MLEELSKRDSEWRKIATKICGNTYDADDLVSEMYLKLHRINPDKANTSYVSYCMYHIFLNSKNKNKKTVYLNDFSWIEKEVDTQTTNQRIKIDQILNELNLVDRELLLLVNEFSLRGAEEELRKTTGDKTWSYQKINYQAKNAFNKLLETNGIKTLLKNGL